MENRFCHWRPYAILHDFQSTYKSPLNIYRIISVCPYVLGFAFCSWCFTLSSPSTNICNFTVAVSFSALWTSKVTCPPHRESNFLLRQSSSSLTDGCVSPTLSTCTQWCACVCVCIGYRGKGCFWNEVQLLNEPGAIPHCQPSALHHKYFISS